MIKRSPLHKFYFKKAIDLSACDLCSSIHKVCSHIGKVFSLIDYVDENTSKTCFITYKVKVIDRYVDYTFVPKGLEVPYSYTLEDLETGEQILRYTVFSPRMWILTPVLPKLELAPPLRTRAV